MHLTSQLAQILAENTPPPDPGPSKGGFVGDFTAIVHSLEGLLEAAGVLLSALVAFLSARTYRRLNAAGTPKPPEPPEIIPIPPPNQGGST